MIQVKVQTDDFDVNHELAQLRADHAGIGAIVNFIGLVRDLNHGETINTLTLEHYPAMTEKSLYTIAEKAQARWDVVDVLIIHRVGALSVSDQIVLVAVTSAHRQHAFQACEYVMDYLKTQAPFWKKESTAQGEEHWVEAQTSDDEALKRWQS